MERKTVLSWGGRLLVAFSICLLLLFIVPGQSYAQVDTGTILGTVSDSTGARISGATVTLTNEGTNAALSTTTGDDGGYKFTPVRIGKYKIAVSQQGFQTTTQTSINVNVGENVVVDFSLKPGSISETVEVTSTVPVLQSQDASVGQVIDSRSVNDLPLNGRNFTFLAQLSAVTPRLYSIASCLAAHPGEAHLCISVVASEPSMKGNGCITRLPQASICCSPRAN